MTKITVREDKGSLFSRFTVEGERYTHFYKTVDRAKCEVIAAQIALDISQGSFDPTLESYKLDRAKSLKRLDKLGPMFLLWMQGLDLEEKTRRVHYAPIYARIPVGEKVGADGWLKEASKDWSSDTWNQRIGRVKAFGEWLRSEGYLPLNPYRSLKRRKSEREEYVPFTPEELGRINAHIKVKNPLLADFYLFLALTGCRPAEVIGLRWGDISEDGTFITIGSALARSANGSASPNRRERKGTKTGVTRKIPVSPAINCLLESRLAARSQQLYEERLVFVTPHGHPVDDRNALNRVWKPALEALGIPYRVPYAARHTAISQLLSQGVPAIEVAKQMGTSLEMIDRHYGHTMDGPMRHVDYGGELG